MCCLISNLKSSKWIVDSGATNHICNDINLFININDISQSKHYIAILDGSKHKVTKIENVKLNERLILIFLYFKTILKISFGKF